MRIAAMIIGLPTSVLVLGYSFLSFLGNLGASSSEGMSGAASTMLVAGLLFLGSAFVLGIPLVAAFLFGCAALLAFPIAVGLDFGSLYLWGIVSLLLMGMSIIGWHDKRREEERRRQEYQTSVDRAVAAGLAARSPGGGGDAARAP